MALLQKNIYVCGRGHETVTVDVDEGVTPFVLRCRMLGCDAMSYSEFYPSRAGALEATLEWYRPAADDACMSDSQVREHVEMGGLMPRAVPL